MAGAAYKLWARSPWEESPSLRASGFSQPLLRSEGEQLARASGDAGVMSVWVEDANGQVSWSAGEKWNELHAPTQQEPN